MTRIFFRDDDVGELNDSVVRFTEVFLQRSLPVSYQVVPTFLTGDAAAYFSERQAAAPRLIHLNQHGLKHSQQLQGKHCWSEFAGGRPYADQLQDIQQGKEILQQKLGAAFDPSIFTPPQHKYDRNTLLALRAAGFDVLSASYYPRFKHQMLYRVGRLLGMSSLKSRGISRHGQRRPDSGLYELSVSVFADDGSQRATDLDELLGQVLRSRRYLQDVGVMLHHAAWKTDADVDFLNRFLDRLQQVQDVTFHSMNELAPGSCH